MAYEPTTGETPIDSLPAYGGAGGDITSGRHYAGKKFLELFGRNPTASELTMLAPAYIGGDGRIANMGQGDAAVAQYFQSFSNSPEQINKGNRDKYAKEAPQHYDSVNKLFQENWGREATQEELDHFGSELASGSADAYQLQQFLRQQPEYTQKQDAAFRSGLSNELAGYDRETLEKTLLPSIQSNFAKQGRSVDSSAFASAAANAAQGQTADRGRYIAGLSASQYEGSKDRAYQDYANMVAQQQSLKSAGLQAQYGGQQALTGRLNDITDFNTQSQLYNQYLARYGKRNNGLAGPLAGLAGAGIGAAFGGPAGGMLGFQLGNSLGSAGQNAASGSY